MTYPKTDFQTLLSRLNVCQEARLWVGGMSLAAAWAASEHPDWMLSLAARMVGREGWPTQQQLVLAACAVAETVLPVFEAAYPGNSRPRVALATARAWTNGKATLEKVQVAADAAYAVAPAHAAYAAAHAAKLLPHRVLAQLVRDNLAVPLTL